MAKPSKSKSPTTTNPLGTRSLPKNRPPTHLGEMLLQDFIIPLEITQTELAKRLDVSYPRLNELINKRRSVTPDTAARVLGMSTEFWLDLQQNWDLWHVMNSPAASKISELILLTGNS